MHSGHRVITKAHLSSSCSCEPTSKNNVNVTEIHTLFVHCSKIIHLNMQEKYVKLLSLPNGKISALSNFEAFANENLNEAKSATFVFD